MTTRATKPVHREVNTARGPMIVTLAPEGVYVRRKGTRSTYGPVGYGAIEDAAAKMYAAAKAEHVPLSRRRTRRTTDV